MSSFQVSIRRISEVIPHPNADRLTIYCVNGLGYRFISNVKYSVGDYVVYFPVDSVMPASLIEAFELGTMLAGKDHNRVKTVRLRGEISQGFISDLESTLKLCTSKRQSAERPKVIIDTAEILETIKKDKWEDLLRWDLKDILGVTKWEPPAVPCQNGDLVPLPPGNSMYDIEGCENCPHIVQWLIDEKIPVVVTEKLEGQNFSVTVMSDGREFVSQRRYSIREKEGGEHDMWEVARREGILDLAKRILIAYKADDVTLYGEHLGPGIQGNYYHLKERTVRFFDLKINGKWIGALEFFSILSEHTNNEDRGVPVYWCDGTLDRYLEVVGAKTLQKASHGKSGIHKDRLREGIVIRPQKEIENHPFVSEIGTHLIIKQRDPIYLDKTGN